MIWDGLIAQWGHDPLGMSEEEKTLMVAAVADRVVETREGQLMFYLVHEELKRANAIFNEVQVEPEVLARFAAIARTTNGILKALERVREEREAMKMEQTEPIVEEDGQPYEGPTTGQKGDV